MGQPTIFIRLGGCNLNCSICDTKYARKPINSLSSREILKLIKSFKTPYICITGGEPLIQKKNLKPFINELLKMKKIVSIETNGSILVDKLPKAIKKVIDVKTPSTGEGKSFDLKNLKHITKNDEIKFVISNKKDFDFSIEFIKTHNIQKFNVPILFSPNLSVKGLASDLVRWILKSGLPIVFQPQLHKLIKEKPIYLLTHKNQTTDK
ncbi:MAG: radical SAM protein [Proteobacteria bacterium]|nr:radical SAM protein [Pseudomonadota bacterium]